jgi:proteic killer suppression protein
MSRCGIFPLRQERLRPTQAAGERGELLGQLVLSLENGAEMQKAVAGTTSRAAPASMPLPSVIRLTYHRPRHKCPDMIRSFRDRATERLWMGAFVKRFGGIEKQALRKLDMLHHARDLNDLRTPPANRLEALTGNRRGQYSIRINDQWRVCFTWTEEGPANVEIVDYH